MHKLKLELDRLNAEIRELEAEISKSKLEAEATIRPLNDELSRLREEKRNFASKNDFDSVQECNRKQNNLKFKINAQWNSYSMLKEKLLGLNKQKNDVENRIKLEEDRIKRNREIVSRMDAVLECYRKTRNLSDAAIESKISPENVEQWLEWGRNDYGEVYSYFYEKKTETDEYFRQMDSDELKMRMDRVIEAYRKTKSLKDASQSAGVSHDEALYWYEWGSRGFGEENAYFYREISRFK